MDPRIQSSFDKELMRMAMLKHEEIFREQVCELHRLYRIQKLLMKEVQKSSSSIIVNKQGAVAGEIKGMQQNNQKRRNEEETNDVGVGTGLDESEIQLTLGPSIYSTTPTSTTATKRRLSNQRSPSSLSSSNSTTQIHNSNDHHTREHQDLTWGDFIRPENNHHHHHHSNAMENKMQMQMQMMMNGANTIGTGIGDEHHLENRVNSMQHPPWLFQPLSLKLSH